MRCSLALPTFLDFSEHKGELLLPQLAEDLSALLQAGGFAAPWLLHHLFVSLPAPLPAPEESPVQLQSQREKRHQPLPSPNPADANGHLTSLIMTAPFLPGQPTRRSQPHALLLRPSHLPPRLLAGPHHAVCSCSPSLHCQLQDLIMKEKAKRMGGSMKLGATKLHSRQAVLQQNFLK